MEKTYSGATESEAQAAYEADADTMAAEGLQASGFAWSKEVRRLRPDVMHLTVTYGAEDPWTGVRFYRSGAVRVNYATPQEARGAIAELRMKKKELALQKKGLGATATALRADHRARVARLAPTDRQPEKEQLTRHVASLDERKSAIDAAVLEIDRMILDLDRFAKGLG